VRPDREIGGFLVSLAPTMTRTRRLILGTLLIGALTWTGASEATAQTGMQTRFCGVVKTTSGHGSYLYRASVRARATTCALARRVATGSLSGRSTPRGWQCLASDANARCTRGHRVVSYHVLNDVSGDSRSLAASETRSRRDP
jgi:hypothetical protein